MEEESFRLTADEFLSISLDLEQFHAVFYQLWSMGQPVFTDTVKTAAVSFDPDGEHVDFVFNPKFWQKLTPYQRQFVISHECLHIIFNHGVRCRDATDHDTVNRLLDVAVNETLVRSFGFDKSQLGDLHKNGCWVDTIWPDDPDMPTDQSFEYYYNHMPADMFKIKSVIDTLDNHEGLAGSDMDSVIEKLNGVLTKGEKEALRGVLEKHFTPAEGVEGSQAGIGTGGWTFITVKPVQKKKKWETVIKEWSRKYNRPEMYDVEQWARINRRFVNLDPSLILPTEMEMDYDAEGKIMVYLFQDTSGSCWHLKDRFFKAARSLNPARFDVRLFCFDTAVKEIDIAKGQIYGGGGTSFHIMEDHIQKVMREEGGAYPEAVFVITDGVGNHVKPQIPERWYWFLTGGYRTYIPKTSNVYGLRDYE